ncbi:MAG: 50S ribosomal protein L18 [Calditrichota bacterium]
MATISKLKIKRRIRRKKHIRKVVFGTAARPRLVVFRSIRQIYAQLVDDEAGKTISGVSSISPEMRDQVKGRKPIEVGTLVGEACAKKALEKNIRQVVFDRNGFPYHGRVKAVADGARKGGLEL